MPFDGVPGAVEIDACVAALRRASERLEQLSPAALSTLARAAAGFVREAKALRRRRRVIGGSRDERARVALAECATGAGRKERAKRRARDDRGMRARRDGQVNEGRSPGATNGAVLGRCRGCRARRVLSHPRYVELCVACGGRYVDRREQTADLSGRVALVTGARVSSGYATALKLLRAGAVVLGTTRFPRDAATRFAAEPDFHRWSGRLHLYGLDFRSPAWVEAFAGHVAATVARLDILINNAAQTVRRPAPFYAQLVQGERAPVREDAAVRRVLAAGRAFAERHAFASGRELADGTSTALAQLGEGGAWSAVLSQLRVLPEDAAPLVADGASGISAAVDGIRDLRASNSWMQRLGEVATAECLEVLLVNAAAPFVLAGRLREVMRRDALADKWIVNVAAVEGQFSRRQKDDRHPHLNMAKAALNMLTRSAAADYARDRIHMNSVDVGWFSNGEPAAVSAAMRRRGFTLPLDEVDAAARVCDPIFTGVRTGANVHGRLLKDYRPVDW